ncbi:MAG: DUF5615 family PIN-like protein, partial [Thermodesulfobacteriota bacterium]
FALIEFLENRGFEVEHLKKMGKAGIKNSEVYKIAEEMEAWIVTRDADFQNMKRFESYNIGGIILFKLSRTKTNIVQAAMDAFLKEFRSKLLQYKRLKRTTYVGRCIC